MPRPPRIAKNSPDAVFGLVDLRQLRKQLGPTAERLLPLLAEAAVKYSPLEGETLAADAMRRRTAIAHIDIAKRTERTINELLDELKSATPLIQQAVDAGYLPLPQGSGTFGALETIAEMERSITILRNAANLHAARLRAWRRAAEADSKRKRGRKAGGRLRLAEWMATLLQRAGVRLTKAKNGRFAKALTIVYDAAGIERPQDLSRDVYAAVDYARRKDANRAISRAD